MADYTTLKTAVQIAIKANNNNEITGKILQQQLLAMINSLGSGYQLAGILMPSDTPKTDDQRVAYLAVEPGMYEHAGGFEVTELSLLMYDTAWEVHPLGVPFGSQIAAVIKALQDADKANAKAIADEKTSRTTAILAEQQAREQADTTLQENIDKKQDTISDLTTIRTQAAHGQTAFSWGDHSKVGYITGITKAMVEDVLTGNITSHTHTFASLADKPTTISGYGIRDAYTKAETDRKVVELQGLIDSMFERVYDSNNKLIRVHSNVTISSSGDLVAGSNSGGGGTSGGGKNYLNELLDVQLATSSLNVGDMLMWNGDKYVNIPQSSITPDLSEYATQQWVLDKKYLTSVPVASVVGQTGNITTAQVATALTDAGYKLTDTTYELATAASNGLMSATDKTKLNGIAENANNYTLPTASSTTKGGIKVGTTLSISGEVLNLKSGFPSGTYTKVQIDDYGRVSSGSTLSASDIPSLPWSKITTGKPTTISGYGITDAYTKTETDNKVEALQSLLDSMFERVYDSNNKLIRIHSNVTISSSGDIVAGGDSGGGTPSGGAYTQLEWNAIKALTQSESGLLASAYSVKEAYDELNTAIETLAGKATAVSFSQTLTSGKQIGTISIDGKSTSLFAPANYAWSEITGKPSFATVATSGSYTDLANKPTIASLMGSTAIGGESAYPYWNGSAWATKALGSNAFTSISKVSQLTNDSGYITGITKAMVEGVLTGNITSHTHTFDSLTSKPTTISGYGITDAVVFSTDIDITNHDKLGTIGYGYAAKGWATSGPAISFGANAKFNHQIQADVSSGNLVHRNVSGNPGSWMTILDSGNYNSYALPLSGGTIGGTLRITNSLLMGNYNLYDGAETTIFRNASTAADYGTLIVNGSISGTTRFLLDKSGIFFYDVANNIHTLLHSGNYNSYAPKLDGTGASGTWGISISGNAATATNADYAGYSSYTKSLDSKSLPSSKTNAANTVWCKFARITVNSAWSVASGYLFFGGDEATDHSAILRYHFRASSTDTTLGFADLIWLVKSNDTISVIAVKAADNIYDLYVNNLSTYVSPRIYHMSATSSRFSWSVGSWTTTKPTAAYTASDYGRVHSATFSGSATKLANSRTLWGQSFNGTGDVSGALTGVTTITTSGQICINTSSSQRNNYNEGIRCNLGGSDNWASVVLGGASGSTNGAGSGVYSLLVNSSLFRIRQNSTEVLCINTSNNVGIGTTSPSYKLHIVGTAYATENIIAAGDLTAGSDIRYKDKIQDLRLSVHDIALAPAFTYKWNNREDALVHIGSSAQYWLNTDAKDAVYYDKQNDFYHLNYASLALCNTVILARGMETQEEKIARLEDRIKELEDKLRQYDSNR